MTGNDTEEDKTKQRNQFEWSLDDRIRWVEWRIRQLTIRNGQYIDGRAKWLLEERALGGRRLELGDQVADYAVWLLKVRDNLSWHQIAYRCFPGATEKNIEKYESKARRIYDRVERNHPGSKRFEPRPLSKDNEFLLHAMLSGVVPVYISDVPAASRTNPLNRRRGG